MSKSTEKIWKQYEKGLDFNNKLRLAQNVQNNENFFIGRELRVMGSPLLFLTYSSRLFYTK